MEWSVCVCLGWVVGLGDRGVCVMSLFSGSWQDWQQWTQPNEFPDKSPQWQCDMISNLFVVKRMNRLSSFFSSIWIMHDFIWSPAFLTFFLALSLQPFHLGMFILLSEGVNDGCSCCSTHMFTQNTFLVAWICVYKYRISYNKHKHVWICTSLSDRARGVCSPNV